MTDLPTADGARKKSQANAPDIETEKVALKLAIDTAMGMSPPEFSTTYDMTSLTVPKRKTVIRYLRELKYVVVNNANVLDISWE